MEIKKSKKAEMESWRKIFFLIGLIITLSGLLVAFEWKTHSPIVKETSSGGIYLDDELILNTQRKKPKPPKHITMIIDKFKIIKNNTKLKLKDEVLVPNSWDEGLSMDSMIMEDEVENFEPFYPFPQIPPKFPTDLREYLLKNVHYPMAARQIGSQGIVYIKFEISSKGNVRNIQISRGIDPLLDQEAIRVIKNMPPWKPAIQGDIPVATSIGISIKFILKN